MTATCPYTLASLAAVTWDFKLVGRTRMLTEAWARAGQPTVFVQVPSYRTAIERLTAWARPRPSVPVVRPWPTVPARRWTRYKLADLEARIRGQARRLRRQLGRRIAFDRAAAIVVSPIWLPWLAELPFRHVVYDCIDDLRVHVKYPALGEWLARWETQLLARASGAVVTAERLRDNLHARRADLPLVLIRNGVDVDWFQRQAAETPPPPDVPRGGRPLVGFVGALYDWIDWALIRDVATQLAQMDFVFVGPHDGRGDVRQIAHRPNVHLLGARPYARVPAYVNAFDVCWVPFVQDAVAEAANPVKIYEYLALGKPVVSTPVADTAIYGNLVAVGRTAEEVAAALRNAVVQHAGHCAARVDFARQNTWAARAAEFAAFVGSLG